jgi:hypothetical protein
MKTSAKVVAALEKGRELLRKKVGKYDINNNLIAEYKTITEASILNNISRSSISKVCLEKPKYKMAAGYIWKYI